MPTMAPGAAFSSTLKADAATMGGRTGALVLVALADEVADKVVVTKRSADADATAAALAKAVVDALEVEEAVAVELKLEVAINVSEAAAEGVARLDLIEVAV